jgi:hypothetical protein
MVIVNCGGRTRSIIGAQSLINAGVANKAGAEQQDNVGRELLVGDRLFEDRATQSASYGTE